MKFLGKGLFSVVLISISLNLSSCIPDHCVDTICRNGGVCVLGNCSCPNGYEGQNCDEVWNQRFLGTWFRELPDRANVILPEEDSLPLAKTRLEETSLIANGRADQFVIQNIGQMDSILCRRVSHHEFAIVENQFIDSFVTILSGSGRIDSSGKTIIGTYTIENRNHTTVFSLNLTK